MAIAVFVGFGLAVWGAVGRAAEAAQRSRWESTAADLARSAMAKIESGAARAEALQGPAYRNLEGSDGRDGAMPGDAELWELDIRTEASAFEGLTHVAVKAVRKAGRAAAGEAASFTLHQLVRLDARVEGSR